MGTDQSQKPRGNSQLFPTGCKRQRSSTVGHSSLQPVQTHKIWALSCTLFPNLCPSNGAVRVLRQEVSGSPLCPLPGMVSGTWQALG